MSIQKKIKMLRLENRFTQVDVSIGLNCSVPAYSKVETGATDITDSRLQQLAKFYNMKVADLYNHGEPEDNSILLILDQLKEYIRERDERILHLQGKLIEMYDDKHGGK